MRHIEDNVNQSGQAAPEDVLEVVHRLMHEYRSLQYRFLKDGSHDLTHMEAKVLGFFSRRPGSTQSDLAAHTGRDKAQLARLIKSLRDRELLAAEVDEADRRNVKLSVSQTGQAVQRGLRQQEKRLSAKAVAGLSDAEKEQLLSLLQRVRKNVVKGTELDAR